jgi:hypothetical protein
MSTVKKRRRFLTSLDMTINGGGKSPLLQLHPRRNGGDPSLRSGWLEVIPRNEVTRDLQYSRRWIDPPRTPPIKDLDSFLGKGGDPSLRSGRHFVSVRKGFPIQMRGLDITPSRLPQMKLKSFRGKFERGTLPLSIE